MLNTLMIGISYVVLFSLLLSLNFFTKFSFKIKLFFTITSLLFFITSYTSIREMQGRPYKDSNLTSDYRPYKILWHGVNEPNKSKGINGKIYILPHIHEGVSTGSAKEKVVGAFTGAYRTPREKSELDLAIRKIYEILS